MSQIEPGGEPPDPDGIASKKNNVNNTNNNNASNALSSTNDFHERVAKNRFRSTDKGPFFIFVEGLGKDAKIGKQHPMVFGRWLFNLDNINKRLITNVSSVGGNRMKIEFATARAANEMVTHNGFVQKQYFAYIPDSLICKTGVVRNVDPSLTDLEILTEMVSPIEPVRIKRLTKTIVSPDGSRKTTILSTCFVTFNAQTIPNFVSIFGARCKVDTYIPPVRQCSGCYRIGHIQSQCKSGLRCLYCAEEHLAESCPKKARMICINCKSVTHIANSKDCPVYLERVKSKREKLMADSYATITQNSFGVLSELDDNNEAFPTLQSANALTDRKSSRNPPRATPYKKPEIRQRKTDDDEWYNPNQHPNTSAQSPAQSPRFNRERIQRSSNQTDQAMDVDQTTISLAESMLQLLNSTSSSPQIERRILLSLSSRINQLLSTQLEASQHKTS